MFSAPKESRDSRDPLSRLKTPDNCNPNESVHGFLTIYNKSLMVKRGKIHAEISRELSGHIEAEFLSDALPDASDLCWENINSNLEGFYCTLIKKTYCDNHTKTKTGE